MAYELVAPPGLTATLLPGQNNVLIQWTAYQPADLAGHHVIGYRLFRNTVPNVPGTLVANENVLNPLTTSFSDLGEPIYGQTAYYTLVAVECTDYGARPYGEGGNVPYGA